MILTTLRGSAEADKAVVSRRNVFPFSMSVAAHSVLQVIGQIAGFERIGGCGPQRYDGYPGRMKVEKNTRCDDECEFLALTASAPDLSPNLKS